MLFELQEVAFVFRGVHVQDDDLHASGSILFVDAGLGLGFRNTGHAPGGHGIEHHHVAAVFGQGVRARARGSDREAGGMVDGPTC